MIDINSLGRIFRGGLINNKITSPIGGQLGVDPNRNPLDSIVQQGPDQNAIANNMTYREMLRKHYSKRPIFGSPDYQQQYAAWRAARPTGKDLVPTYDRAIQQNRW